MQLSVVANKNSYNSLCLSLYFLFVINTFPVKRFCTQDLLDFQCYLVLTKEYSRHSIFLLTNNNFTFIAGVSLFIVAGTTAVQI